MPEATEEASWIGTRWQVRGRSFAHLLRVADGQPPAYARAAGTDGPATLLMLRSSDPAFFEHAGPPYLYAGFGRDEVGIVLEGTIDVRELVELLTDSYRERAPRSLVSRLPQGTTDPL